jgi:hypothetical protein
MAIMDRPIDHDGRSGPNYEPKPVTDETRKKRSEAMKEFNKKTGKVAQTGNGLMQHRRKAKASQ